VQLLAGQSVSTDGVFPEAGFVQAPFLGNAILEVQNFVREEILF
jgi:hypothetical protein